jgi:hypothetical protein
MAADAYVDSFRERAQGGTGWFEFLVGELAGEPEGERWRAVDRALELIARLRRPLQRDERLEALARALSTPVEGVRAQFESLPERRRQAALAQREARAASAGSEPDTVIPAARRAYQELCGGALLEPALAPLLAPFAPACPDGELRRLMEAIVEVHRRDGDRAGVAAVLVELGSDPARNRVVPILDEAAGAEEPRSLFEGAARFLGREEEGRRIRAQAAQVARRGDPERSELEELHRRMRARVI